MFSGRRVVAAGGSAREGEERCGKRDAFFINVSSSHAAKRSC
jgi:hypothetical protein